MIVSFNGEIIVGCSMTASLSGEVVDGCRLDALSIVFLVVVGIVGDDEVQEMITVLMTEDQ